MWAVPLLLAAVLTQQPQQPTTPSPSPFPLPAAPATRPGTEPTVQPAPPPAAPAVSVPPAERGPNETTLGVPVYQTAQFLASYDAGRGQRFYIYGAAASFLDLVNFYRTVLKQKGELVFDVP